MVIGVRVIKEKLTPLVIGVFLAFLSILNPVFMIFIIPSSLLFIGQKKPEKKILIVIVGFLMVYFPFLSVAGVGIQEQGLTVYNILKNNIIDTNLGDIRSIEDIKLIDDFEAINDYKMIKAKEDSARLLYTSEEFYEGNKSLKIEVNLPTKNEIRIQKKINPENWKEYSYLNIWIKNKGGMGWFGVILSDEDGDYWQYDNNQILKQQDWTLLKIPIRSLKNYGFIQQGDGKLDNIKEYILKFDKTNKEGEFTAYIDKIYLSKI